MSFSLCLSQILTADLDIRHYSYECKSTTQDRPYVSRPSRTQQLQNPDLVPKLKNETMVDMTTRTYGTSAIFFSHENELT